jgi:hypothetical protein
MKKVNILYWIFTAPVLVILAIGAVFEIISYPEAIQQVTRLGYPGFLVPFLGAAKLLGIVVIVIPRYRLLKEWAYAGIAFDLLGALYSTIAIRDSWSNCIGIILPVLFLSGSYLLYHKKAALVTA